MKTYIKSILALATAALLGSSAQAATITTTLSRGASLTTFNYYNSSTTSWSVSPTSSDGVTASGSANGKIYNVTFTASDTATANAKPFVVYRKSGSTLNTYNITAVDPLRLKTGETSGYIGGANASSYNWLGGVGSNILTMPTKDKTGVKVKAGTTVGDSTCWATNRTSNLGYYAYKVYVYNDAGTSDQTVCVGEEFKPNLTAGKAGTWGAKSSNANVASVSVNSSNATASPTITGKAEGSADITVSNMYYQITYRVTVVKPTEVSLCVGDTAQLYFYNSTKKSWTTSLNDTAFTETTAQSGNGVTVTRSAGTSTTRSFNILVTASTAGKSDTIIVSDGSNTYYYRVTTSAARTVQIDDEVSQTCVSGLSRVWTPTGDTYASVKVNPTTAATSVTATITGKAIGSSSVTVNNANTSSTTTGSLGANYTLKTTVTKKQVQGAAKTVAVGKTVTIDDESSASAWTGKSAATGTAMVTASGNAGVKPVITGKAIGNTTVTIENTTTIYTYAVTVTEAPLEFEYESVNFVVTGAEKSFVDGELLLKFTKSGTMTIDGGLNDVRYLVVGGGNKGTDGTSASQGQAGGNGGQVVQNKGVFSSGPYTITIGAGQTSTTSSSASSLVGGSLNVSASAGLSTSTDGTSSDIEGGNAKYYGKKGQTGASNTQAASGDPNTGNGGQGGYRTSTYKNGGAGGSGVVILRIPAQKPVQMLDPVTLYTGNKTTVSTACSDPSVIKVTSDKANVATATAEIDQGTLTITVQAGETTGTANIKVETASSFYTVAATVNAKPTQDLGTKNIDTNTGATVKVTDCDDTEVKTCTDSPAVHVEASIDSGTLTIVLSPKGAAASGQVVKVETDVCVYSITVNVAKAPLVFKGHKITVGDDVGIDKTSVPGELILTFTTIGANSLKIEGDGDATAQILLVGGGAGGVFGKASSQNTQCYAGNGGNGGEVVEKTGYPLPSGEYEITVGKGGAGVAAKGGTDLIGGASGDPSTLKGGSIDLIAKGGVKAPDMDVDAEVENNEGLPGSDASGCRTKKATENNPAGGTWGDCTAWDGMGAAGLTHDKTGVTSEITGSPAVYGEGGLGSKLGTGKNDKGNGADAQPDEYGKGGGGSRNEGASGNGGQGCVIVRLAYTEPVYAETCTVAPLLKGDQLSDRLITLVMTNAAGAVVNGTVAWKDPTLNPTISGEQTIVFTPDDTAAYAVTELPVNLIVVEELEPSETLAVNVGGTISATKTETASADWIVVVSAGAEFIETPTWVLDGDNRLTLTVTGKDDGVAYVDLYDGTTFVKRNIVAVLVDPTEDTVAVSVEEDDSTAVTTTTTGSDWSCLVQVGSQRVLASVEKNGDNTATLTVTGLSAGTAIVDILDGETIVKRATVTVIGPAEGRASVVVAKNGETTVRTTATITSSRYFTGDASICTATDLGTETKINGVTSGEAELRFYADGTLVKIVKVRVVDSLSTYDWNDQTIKYYGAATPTEIGGDLLFAFMSDAGALELPEEAVADVLVVGGGASGAATKGTSGDGSNTYRGAGGGGAEAVYDEKATLPKGAYTIQVGAGGPSMTATVRTTKGSAGGDSAFSNGGSVGYVAAGGVPGDSSVVNTQTPKSGAGGAELTCSITDSEVTYGINGLGATQDRYTPGTDATEYGQGGQGGHDSASGAGFQGVVYVRLKGFIETPVPATGADAPKAEALEGYDELPITGKMVTGAGVEVPGTWAWAGDMSGLTAEQSGNYPAVFTPKDATFFRVVQIEVPVTIMRPVEVPTAVTGLVYDYTEKTGVVAQTGYTLTGNTATNAGSYTATATLADGYVWKNGSPDPVDIAWEIAYKSATVTAVSTNKLFGTTDPEFDTKEEGFIAGDPSVRTWVVWTVARTNTDENVGFYDLIVSGEARQGSYDITYVNAINGFEIRAGKVTVNGKGYDDVAAAFAALTANGGTATFNEAVTHEGYSFAAGSTLEFDKESGAMTVTGNLTLAADLVDANLTVNGTLTLGDDVSVTNSVLAFDEISVDAYRLAIAEADKETVVSSKTQLTIADVFAAQDHYEVVEAEEKSGDYFVYTLQPKTFYVKYYAGDEVVHSNDFTVENYETDLQIWNGEREGLNLVGYQKENGDPLEKTDAALRAYIAEEAAKEGCDGEVKVFGTWNTCVEVPTAIDGLVYDGNEQTGVVESVGFTLTDNAKTDAGDYTATATLADGYCWSNGSTDQKTIDWSIAAKEVEVTAEDESMLVGDTLPTLTYKITKGKLVDGEKLTGTLTVEDELTVGMHGIVQANDWDNPNYAVKFVVGTLTVDAGKITVNGKGYDDIEEAINNLKQNSGTAVCNDDIDWYEKGIKFSNGAVLEYDREEDIFTVTGNMTVPKVTAEEVLAVDGTLTLNGDLYADDKGAANVDAEKVVLGKDVTVGKVDDGETEEIAVLAFEEIDIGDYKLTLTVNGIVRSATALDIAATFTDAPEFFQITETQIDGGYEYKLEALNVVEVPTAVDGLVYNGNEQTGVEEGEGYTLTGNTGKDADDYTATATLADGYIWADGSTEEQQIVWSIDYAQATVTANDASKFEGQDDPPFTAKVAGEVAGEEGTIKYTLEREEGEDPGPYTICAEGDETQGNYKVTFVDGTFTIYPKPTITIHVKQGEGIFEVKDKDGESVNKDLELPAETKEVKLTLEADDNLTVPVFKVVTNGVDGVVTSVTTKVATYAIKDRDTLEFFAEEAKEDDPAVTPEQRKQAIIDAIDPPDPKDADDVKRYNDAKAKVEAVVDTADEPAPDKVSAKDMAAWITDNGIKSADMAQSDYLVASVKLDTEEPITAENTTIEFKAIEEVSSEAFTFDLSMIVDSESVDFEEGMEKVVASCIQATGDLGTGFDGGTVNADRVTITADGKVTIEPDSTKSAEFFKIVIPKDPGAK